jgi:hypothetical protein
MPPFKIEGRREQAQPVSAVAGGPALPAATFGGPEATALETIGQTARQLAGSLLDIEKSEEQRQAEIQRRQDNNDKAAAANAYIISGGSYNDWEVENFQKKGLTAQGLAAQYQTWQAEADRNAIDQLENDNQKNIYRTMALERNISNAKRVAERETTEVTNGHRSSYQALVDSEVNNGIIRFDSPDHIATAEDNIEIAAAAIADLDGLTKLEQNAIVAENLSKMHTANVERWAIDDAETARKYFETHKDKIDPTLYDELETVMKVEDTSQKALDVADEAMLQGETTKESLDWIDNNVEDADVRRKAKADVRTMKKDEQDAINRDNRIYLDNVTGQVSDLYRGGSAKIDVDKLADGIKNGNDRAEMRGYIDSLYKDRNKTKETNFAKMTELNERIRNGQVTTPMQIDLEYSRFLSDQAVKEAKEFLANGGNAGKVNYNDVKSEWLIQADKKKFNQTDDKEMAQFGAVYDYVIQQSNTIAGDPTRPRINQWVAEGLMQVEIPGTQRRFLGVEFETGEEVTTRAEALRRGELDFRLIVPDDREDPIKEALEDLGVEASQENIQLYYEEVDSQTGVIR